MHPADPSPLEYASYRAYLRAWLEGRAGQPSLRTLARRMGCSPSLLSRVLSGERDLELGRVDGLAQAMRLSDPAEIEALRALIEREHAPTSAWRAQAARRVEVARELARAAPVPDDDALVWPGAALLELLRCPGAPADAEALSRLLRPPATPEQVEAALERLRRARLLPHQGEAVIWIGRTAGPVPSTRMQALLASGLARALDDLAAGVGDPLKGAVLVLALPADALPALREATQRYIDALVALPAPGEGDAVVVEVVVHAHPVSDPVPAPTTPKRSG